jgi:hypothetical protein
MTNDDQAPPASKCPKYTAYSLSEKIWCLDYSKQNPDVNGEDCGKALAAKVNASLPEHEKRSAPNKNAVNGWKREESKMGERFEKEFAQGIRNTVRAREAKHAEMEEALYVWFRQMQGRDMTLTENIVRSKANQVGTQLGVPETYAYSSSGLHNFIGR